MSGYIEHAAEVMDGIPSRILHRETRYHGPEDDYVFSREEMIKRYAEALAAAGLRIVTAEEEAVLAAVDAYDKVRESWDGTRDGYTQLVDAQTAMLRAIRARRAAEATP